ncbi:YhdH/YhfP family quinone oxidoreductase [Mangrovibacterium diazotrophicum]|uniref:Putative YhdH/YhfP family quinone oxidoreductase n=1 Tax=Mangrovibacterium diazotrophicum TaxID=1261403 RepID=A0A419VV43_9BACT|nr:YhdH/YhfP family quinone oxidoreductase [Mangrovibacterium diazotrophicum]RKD86019.1 putative YhdH/YhfP family quinone oxidoreductase [Mangrovibacterium diazotrophicum]
MSNYQAFVVRESDGVYSGTVEKVDFVGLQDGEVRVKVEYSSLNYKDALSASGNKGVTKNYPHIPGIDAAGVVTESKSTLFGVGDLVIVSCYDLGMNHPGGYAEYIQVPESWVIPMPTKMTTREAMVYGTAGFTAALSVYRLLQNGQKPEMGPIVVTGALGGVGSIACQILNKLKFDVIAASSNGMSDEMMNLLGATSQFTKMETDDQSGRPMLRSAWGGAIDVVGGNTLTTLLKACNPLGNVTTCGNIGSGDLNMTVYPFILRGVSLLGVDAQSCPMPLRREIWNLLAADWAIDLSDQLVFETDLDGLNHYIQLMLTKKSRGRVVVKL